MINVSGTHQVNASSSTVWRIISEIDGIHKWHPKVLHSPLLSNNPTGEGSARKCEFHDGTSVVETVTGWKEGESISMVLTEMSMPMKSASTVMSVQATGVNSSTVTIEMSFEPKFGMLGHLMGLLVMRPMMKMVFKQVIKGLNTYIANGEIVDVGA
ncbi:MULTISPECIES: SRPBCC family protein [Colwellia]|uniref:Polyketide cyclase n=1 Tax=Colwellia marinimaniae TaxID=1513592 RepID=A0ABQ0MWQ4_9GAMM|nr:MULTISPECIES: SRPBCC family protein [Colwellia]GAW96812.1 hypothetical protein MTCD1_02435 [Colwellia marinimaniae]